MAGLWTWPCGCACTGDVSKEASHASKRGGRKGRSEVLGGGGSAGVLGAAGPAEGWGVSGLPPGIADRVRAARRRHGMPCHALWCAVLCGHADVLPRVTAPFALPLPPPPPRRRMPSPSARSAGTASSSSPLGSRPPRRCRASCTSRRWMPTSTSPSHRTTPSRASPPSRWVGGLPPPGRRDGGWGLRAA